MSSNKFDYLNDVQKGRTDWRIKVRVIREWKVRTLSGQPFKGYNLLLLDAKNVRMHAFVPQFLTDRMQKMFTVEKMYIITNFQVKDYTDLDKWRCIHMDRQILFTNQTKAREIKENEYFIPNNSFDFYEIAELRNLANQNIYLADVVGVVTKRDPLRLVHNSKGEDQFQVRMKMTDGRTNINVILWDKLAEDFQEEINTKNFQQPLIVIIASGKVGLWKDELDICNFSPTTYYINYNHHSVLQLRKMSAEPQFTQNNYSLPQPKKQLKLYTVAEIKNLTEDYILEEVVCQVQIQSVEQAETWFYTECTSCYKHINIENGNPFCERCNRIVPEPDKKFGIFVNCADDTGHIEIILMDRPMRTIFGQNVFDMEEEENGNFPSVLKSLEKGHYTIKLIILERNVKNRDPIYLANDIYPGLNFKEETIIEEESRQQPTEQSFGQTSQISFHLDNISQMN